VRVVLDTNVLVSGAITPGGPCREIVDLLVSFAFQLCADHRILEEYHRVLRRPELGIEPAEAAVVLEFIDRAAIHITCRPLPVELPDPADRPFLEVAAEAGAVLVTGNKRHFPKRVRHGVRVLSPREFLNMLCE